MGCNNLYEYTYFFYIGSFKRFFAWTRVRSANAAMCACKSSRHVLILLPPFLSPRLSAAPAGSEVSALSLPDLAQLLQRFQLRRPGGTGDRVPDRHLGSVTDLEGGGRRMREDCGGRGMCVEAAICIVLISPHPFHSHPSLLFLRSDVPERVLPQLPLLQHELPQGDLRRGALLHVRHERHRGGPEWILVLLHRPVHVLGYAAADQYGRNWRGWSPVPVSCGQWKEISRV
jgi:hypothetical protein